jgi:hypothetical protein
VWVAVALGSYTVLLGWGLDFAAYMNVCCTYMCICIEQMFLQTTVAYEQVVAGTNDIRKHWTLVFICHHTLCHRVGQHMGLLVPACGMLMNVAATLALPVQSTHLSSASMFQGHSTVVLVLKVFWPVTATYED